MTVEERLHQIENSAAECKRDADLTISALCEIARQLDRIATQLDRIARPLEKVTSLKYTEDA